MAKPTQTKISQSVLAHKIAVRTVEGAGKHKIAEELSAQTGESISWRQVEKIQNSAECKAIVEDMMSVAVGAAKTQMKSGFARLAAKAIRVFEHHLEENNLQAAIQVAKVLGLEAEEKQDNTNQAITIVMPSPNPEKAVEPAQDQPVIEVGESDEAGS